MTNTPPAFSVSYDMSRGNDPATILDYQLRLSGFKQANQSYGEYSVNALGSAPAAAREVHATDLLNQRHYMGLPTIGPVHPVTAGEFIRGKDIHGQCAITGALTVRNASVDAHTQGPGEHLPQQPSCIHTYRWVRDILAAAYRVLANQIAEAQIRPAIRAVARQRVDAVTLIVAARPVTWPCIYALISLQDTVLQVKRTHAYDALQVSAQQAHDACTTATRHLGSLAVPPDIRDLGALTWKSDMVQDYDGLAQASNHLLAALDSLDEITGHMREFNAAIAAVNTSSERVGAANVALAHLNRRLDLSPPLRLFNPPSS
jgi:S-formylglutathione hydrolase FrmB